MGNTWLTLGTGQLSLSYALWNANLTRSLLEPGRDTSGWGAQLQWVREMTPSQI